MPWEKSGDPGPAAGGGHRCPAEPGPAPGPCLPLLRGAPDLGALRAPSGAAPRPRRTPARACGREAALGESAAHVAPAARGLGGESQADRAPGAPGTSVSRATAAAEARGADPDPGPGADAAR